MQELSFNEYPEAWQGFLQACQSCKACELWKSRREIVVYRGSLEAPLMIIGEGPGREEDLQGKPFVGRSGRLLDDALEALEFPETSYHICNIVKCRPPENRAPLEEEALACRRLLSAQFSLVKPRFVLLCGATAFHYFTGRKDPITRARGIFIESKGIEVLPTFHPAYILRNMNKRDELWQDLALMRAKMCERGELPPLRHPLEGAGH